MNMNKEVQVGHMVCSTKGRDNGKFYLIVGIISNSFVQVADGRIRRLENPKRKNIKHLRIYLALAENITVKVKTGRRITNLEVRKAIESLYKELEKHS